jgi:aldose 1-epimerase
MSTLGMNAPNRHDLITVVAGESQLVLAPRFGGAVVSWTRAGEPLFRLPLPNALQAETPRDLASYPLFPYSNRVAGRRFTFEGQTYDLPDLMNGWAIHGAGWRLPWTAHQADGHVTLTLDYPGGELWPFAFRAEQIFTLDETSLTLKCVVTNTHHSLAPLAFGQHPFFPRTPETTLQFSATGLQRNGPDMLPIDHTPVPPERDHSTARPVGPDSIDNCFTGWTGTARLAYPDRGFAMTITADPIFGNLIVYIPDGRDFLAIEPVTNITDGLNRMEGFIPHGVFVIPPGAQRRGTMRFTVTPL